MFGFLEVGDLTSFHNLLSLFSHPDFESVKCVSVRILRHAYLYCHSRASDIHGPKQAELPLALWHHCALHLTVGRFVELAKMRPSFRMFAKATVISRMVRSGDAELLLHTICDCISHTSNMSFVYMRTDKRKILLEDRYIFNTVHPIGRSS